MMAGVLDQAANPPPIDTSEQALVDLDFINGVYLENGSSVALSTLLDYNTDFIENDIGLWVYTFLWDFDTEMILPNPVPQIIGSGLSALLTGNFTVVIEWATYRNNFAAPIGVADATFGSGKRFAIEDSTSNYFLAYDWLQPGVTGIERDITKDSDTPDSLQEGIHVIALTRTNSYMSASIDGDLVKTVTEEQFGFSEIPLTNAWIGGDNDDSYGNILVGRIRIYDTPIPDENLTALSVVTVMTPLAHDDFNGAIEVFVDTPYEGHTFGSTHESGEPTDSGAQDTTVWHKFTALATDSYDISLAGSDQQGAGSFGWLICVYTLSGMVEVITDLVPFDSAYGYPDPPTLTISATSGTTYYIRLGGDGGEWGHYNLEITLTP